jgi:hypothetical protein
MIGREPSIHDLFDLYPATVHEKSSRGFLTTVARIAFDPDDHRDVNNLSSVIDQ